MPSEKREFKTMDEYIASFPEDIQEVLEKLRHVIRESAPDAEETISYRMPTFKLKGNLVHFAVHKKHVGFYPTPSAIIAFKEELARYETSKGSIRFPIEKPIPFNLVKRIVEFRINEVVGKE